METRGERIGMFKESKYNDSISFFNQYAYPLNTLNKPQIMDKLLAFARTHGVYGLGRWGEHCHYNSDVTVELAMKLADELNV